MQPSHTSLRSGTSACDPPEEDRAGRETIAPRFASMNSTGWPSISGLVVVYASLTRVRLFTFGREALLFFFALGASCRRFTAVFRSARAPASAFGSAGELRRIDEPIGGANGPRGRDQY